ncbi:MAG: hypothetical protein LIP09_01440 [Bacteroidales bacterium]|nr:hypothetical protein [Bacteroidales bacterium]
MDTQDEMKEAEAQVKTNAQISQEAAAQAAQSAKVAAHAAVDAAKDVAGDVKNAYNEQMDQIHEKGFKAYAEEKLADLLHASAEGAEHLSQKLRDHSKAQA